MFSPIIDQKEHKNNWYKFEPATWCYKHHSTEEEQQEGDQEDQGELLLQVGQPAGLVKVDIINCIQILDSKTVLGPPHCNTFF